MRKKKVQKEKPTVNTIKEFSVTQEYSFELQPLPGKIICKEDNFSYTGKLVIPETARRRPTIGTIVGVGEGVHSLLQLGTRIVYGLYSGTVLTFNGQPAYRCLSEAEVLTTVVGDKVPELEGVGV